MSNKRILVADDEPNLVRSLTFILQKEGYATASAANGEEALEKIKQSKPDLVFLDVMMPQKNGYEVCKEVKQEPDLRSINIIILQAKGQEADQEQGSGPAGNEFISKPFGLQEILARVKKWLR